MSPAKTARSSRTDRVDPPNGAGVRGHGSGCRPETRRGREPGLSRATLLRRCGRHRRQPPATSSFGGLRLLDRLAEPAVTRGLEFFGDVRKLMRVKMGLQRATQSLHVNA